MPRPRSLTIAQIAAAALDIVDEAGLEAMSMRTVAGRLGVGTMSLYRYVPDRATLELMVVGLLCVDVDTTVTVVDPAVAIAELAERVRTIGAAHPHAVPLLLAHRHQCPRTLAWAEAVLTVLADAGLGAEDRVSAFRTVLAFVFGAIQTQQWGPLTGPGTRAIAALPAADYPMLTSAAARAPGISSFTEFHRGLAAVLRGLGV